MKYIIKERRSRRVVLVSFSLYDVENFYYNHCDGYDTFLSVLGMKINISGFINEHRDIKWKIKNNSEKIDSINRRMCELEKKKKVKSICLE